MSDPQIKFQIKKKIALFLFLLVVGITAIILYSR